MKYTVNDIKILHPFIYEPTGLTIPYELNGERNLQVLSILALMRALIDTGMILEFDERSCEVKKPAGNWVSMEHYVQNTFDDLVAQDIVLHYLNNTATKPTI